MDIQLVPLHESHLEMVREWRLSKEVSQYMYTNPKISRDQQRSWFEAISLDESKEFYIIRFQEKDLGLASITNINREFKKCQWAFYLGDTSVRGKGIGSKVEYRIIKHVFDDLNLRRLECEIFSFNQKVIKMHESFGFKQEGYFREYIIKNGEPLDVVSMALLKSDWLEIKNSLYKKIYEQ